MNEACCNRIAATVFNIWEIRKGFLKLLCIVCIFVAVKCVVLNCSCSNISPLFYFMYPESGFVPEDV